MQLSQWNLKVLALIFLAVFFVSSNARPSLAAHAASKISNTVQNNFNGTQTLLGHVPSENASSRLIRHAGASEILNLNILLPLRNPSLLDSTLKGLYDPQSPNFHQWLTPAQFTQEFGYSGSEIYPTQIKSYLRIQGLTVTGQSANGLLLHVQGTVPAVEKIFNLHINHYRNSNGTLYYAPDVNPSLPASLAGKILAVSGLDNIARFKAHIHRSLRPVITTASFKPGLAALKTGVGTGPQGLIVPSDIKTAYNMNTIPSTGTGQTLALFELDGYDPVDIQTYETQFNLPSVPVEPVLIDNFSGVPDFTSSGGAIEVEADIELMAAFAPGAAKILVYENENTNEGWIDEWSRIASDNSAKIISCSWGADELNSPSLPFDVEIFSQMAAQGQAVYVASGDSGAYTPSLDPIDPAIQTFATSVGISVLSTNADGSYKSESASNYGGGGASLTQSIPFYQITAAANAPSDAFVSTSTRNVPDVALTADPNTSYILDIGGYWYGVWGSSLSAPIWASFMSLVNQGLGANAPLGCPNAVFYQIAQGGNYANDFHDITTGSNTNPDSIFEGYPAAAGYDDATGLGSFNGLNLYNDLINLFAFTSAPSVPANLAANADFNGQILLSWSASAGASSYNIKRATVNGGPYTIIGTSNGPNTFYTDNALTPGKIYYYVVSAVNAKGQSANSAQVSAVPAITLPDVPTGLQATGSNAQILLSWNPSLNAISYNVKRSSTGAGPYTTIANTPNTDYTDNVKGTYFYVVSAVNIGGESANSSQASATAAAAVPSVPGNIGTINGNNQVQLLWDPSPGAASYMIQRAVAPFTNFSTIASGVTSTFLSFGSPSLIYTDKTAVNGTTYGYQIIAVNAVGPSAPSVLVKATPEAAPAAPVVQIATDKNGIELSWNAPPGSVTYLLKRSTISGGPYVTLHTLAQTSFTENKLTDNVVYGQTYYFVVSAQNGNQVQGPDSAQVSAVFNVPTPAVPTGLAAIGGNAQVSLTWNASLGAAGYSIFRSKTNGGPYSNIGLASTNAYVDNAPDDLFPSLAPVNGTTYYYVIECWGPGGQSAASAQVSATPQFPPSPDGSTLTAPSTGNLSTAVGVWTFGTTANTNGYPILLNGNSAAGGYASLMLVYNSGKLYVKNVQNAWYLWNGSGWTAVNGDPRLPPPAPSSDGTTLTAPAAGSLITSAGTWTFGTTANSNGYPILLNGNPAAGGSASMMLVYNSGKLYVKNAQNAWYLWNGSGWSAVSADPRTPPPTPSPDGTTLTAPSTGNLLTAAGTWTFGTTANSNGYPIMLNGKSAAGGSGSLMLVYNKGQLYVSNTSGAWYLWNGSGFTAVSGDPRNAPKPSPDGTTLTAPSTGSLLTAAGTWTFGTTANANGYPILLNGKSASGGSASMMLVYNGGTMYVENTQNTWYQWTGSGWTAAAKDPRT